MELPSRRLSTKMATRKTDAIEESLVYVYVPGVVQRRALRWITHWFITLVLTGMMERYARLLAHILSRGKNMFFKHRLLQPKLYWTARSRCIIKGEGSIGEMKFCKLWSEGDSDVVGVFVDMLAKGNSPVETNQWTWFQITGTPLCIFQFRGWNMTRLQSSSSV